MAGNQEKKQPMPVKVKIIVTQFVQTDEMDFKSVVQRLTGKDSVIEMPSVIGERSQVAAEEVIGGGSGSGGGLGGWFDELMPPSMVMEEFERVFMEPSLDELIGLWVH